MADDTYVQAIRYEADITDIQHKLNELAAKQTDTEGKTKDSASKMSKHWDGVKDSVAKIATGIGLLGGGMLLMAPKILEGGAALEALGNKASTVFEGSIGKVNDWAAANSKAMGLTSTQARDAAASFADLLKPMGFTADQAAGMSTDMVGLSGALSAWTGGAHSSAEVSDILAKAMLGQRDALDSLGIHIADADVQARLAKNGQKDLTGAALEQAKALATQQLILEKSTDAQKAWSDGSMDAVKKQNSTKASIEQVKESFTKALYPALQGILPIVTKLADAIGKYLPTAIATLRSWISGATQWLGEHKMVMITVAAVVGGLLVAAFVAWAVAAATAAAATLAAAAPVIGIGLAVGALAAGIIYAYTHFALFRETVSAVKDVLVIVWNFISDDLIPIVKVLIEVWLLPLKLAFEAVKAVLTDVLIPAFSAVKDFISNHIIPIFQTTIDTFIAIGTTVGNVVGNIVGFITGLPGRIASTVSGLWSGISTGITAAKDWVGNRITDIVNFVIGIGGRVASWVATAFDGISNAMTSAKDWVHDRIDDVVSFAVGLPGRIGGVFSGMWDGIKEAFKAAINWVIDKWNSFHIPAIKVLGIQVTPQIDFPDIPRFHSGGTVPGLPGADVPALLQAGETVRTRAQEADVQRRLNGDQGGQVINFNAPVTFATSDPPKHFFDEALWRVAG